MIMINLIIPALAVAVNFILRVLIDWKNGTLNFESVRVLSSKLAMYVTAIAALEILGVYEPAIMSWALPAAGVFAASEGIAAIGLLAEGTGNPVVTAIAKAAEQKAAVAMAAESEKTGQDPAGGDPFGAAKG